MRLSCYNFDAFAVIEDNEFDSADCFLRFEKI